MRKTLGAVLVLCVMSLGIYGCPIGDVDSGPMSKDATVQFVKKELNNQGFVCDVGVGDIDENGVEDYAIIYKSVSSKEEKTVEDLIFAVTLVVGVANTNIAWRSDKVYVQVADNIFVASAAGLQATIECAARDCPKEELEAAFLNAWSGEDSQTKQPTQEKPDSTPL